MIQKIQKDLDNGFTLERDGENVFIVSPDTVVETADGPNKGKQVHKRIPVNPAYIPQLEASGMLSEDYVNARVVEESKPAEK